MAELNKYSFYSAVSTIESKNSGNLDKILKQIEEFEKISSLKEAKSFLKQTWGVEEPVKNKSIEGQCKLTVNDNENYYSVVISYLDENLMHYFRK